MQIINQPATVTDMRRSPNKLIERVKKEKILPVLTNSEFEVALITTNELNKMLKELKKLRHENFVYETLQAEREIKEGKTIGPFDTVDDFMNALNNE